MRFTAILLSLSFLFIGSGCEKANGVHTSNSVALGESGASGPANTAVLYVHGMACPQCANNVDLQLLKVRGVKSVKVDMGSGKVTVQLSPSNPPTREQLASAIKQTGFTLVKIEMPEKAG